MADATPDLHQAIQAAEDALMDDPAPWTAPHLMKHAARGAARMAVEAAAPILTGDLRRRLEQADRNTAEAREQIGRLEKANAGLYRQEMAKELRALREFRQTVFSALPTIWQRTDKHADTLKRISDAYAEVDLAARTARTEAGDG